MQTGEIINKALDVFRERGWCRNAIENKRGQVCALGALHYALTGTMDCLEVADHKQREAAVEALARLVLDR